MTPSLILLQAAGGSWSLRYLWLSLWEDHPLICIAFVLFALRGVARWFFGVSRLRRAQEKYTELLTRHNGMLEHQNELLKRHEEIIGKLGEKYLS